MDGIVYRIIGERRQKRSDKMNLLNVFWMLNEETGEGMIDEELHDEVITFFWWFMKILLPAYIKTKTWNKNAFYAQKILQR